MTQTKQTKNWFGLCENFLMQDSVRYLDTLPKSSLYMMVYLKLVSLTKNTPGYLFPYNAVLLSEKMKGTVSVNDIDDALKQLETVGLIDIDGSLIYVTDNNGTVIR